MEKMKSFEQMSVSIFDDPGENEAMLGWLYLTVLGPLAMGLPPLFYRR